MDPPGDVPIAFSCPRCATPVEERFYGPCRTCRAQLVATLAGEGRTIEEPRYEPTMHVVPNQVATQD